MEKDLIFFGEGGITETQANRVADMAKLSYTDEEFSLMSLNFLNESIETINGENSKIIKNGLESLNDIEANVQNIGDLKALCAWLREAIAAHQRLIKEIENYSFEEYCKNHDIKLFDIPKRERILTEDDVIASFDIKKRNRYYYLEAQAATIGQFIHKNGSFDIARKYYYEKIKNPRKVSGSGCDTIIYSYSPSVSKEDIEDVFYKLQQKHTKYQSELNSIKSEIKSRVTNDTIEKTQRYNSEYNKYSESQKMYYNEYEEWKSSELKRISSLKIIIPNSLKDIYNKVNNIGK